MVSKRWTCENDSSQVFRSLWNFFQGRSSGKGHPASGIYITKRFKRVIIGLDVVIYIVNLYNKTFFKACDQWFGCYYIIIIFRLRFF